MLRDVLKQFVGKIDQEIMDKLIEEADADDEKARNHAHKKGQENSSLRARLRKIEGAITKLGFEVDDDLDTKIEEYINKSGSSKEKQSELEIKVNSLLKKLEDEDKAKAELTQKLNGQKISAELRKALNSGNNKVLPSIEDLIVNNYMHSGRAKVIDDQIIFDDGTDLETEINNYRKQNPDHFSIEQKPGSNTSGKQTNKKVNRILKTEFEAMQPKERAEYTLENPDFELIE
jgi:hypothetical protein